MDSRDLPDPRLPALRGSARPALPTRSSAADETPAGLGWRTFARGLARYWKLVLPLWILGTAGALWAIYTFVRPSYEAFSLLKIEPTSANLFNLDTANQLNTGNTFLQTQVSLIKSDSVLKPASLDPKVAALPVIQSSPDAVNDVLRRKVEATVRPGTFLVEVSMRSHSAEEAATIVNAVVDAFLEFHRMATDQSHRKQRDLLKQYKDRLEREANSKEAELTALVDAGQGAIDPQSLLPDAQGDNSGKMKVNAEQFRDVHRQLLDAKLAVSEAEALLARRQAESKVAVAHDPVAEQYQLEQRVLAALNQDPEILDMYGRLRDAYEKRQEAERRTRKPSDPSLIAADKLYKKAVDDYKALRDTKVQTLRASLAKVQVEDVDRNLLEAEAQLAKARARQESVEEMLRNLTIENQKAASGQVRGQFAAQALTVLKEMQASVNKRIEQLDFESGDETRITRIDEASASRAPIKDSRPKLMAAAPLGILALLLGLAGLLEARSGRVTHPDDLASRVRTEVFAIPPLPTSKAGRNDDRRLEQLEEFAQRMDHLRVALCGPATPYTHSNGNGNGQAASYARCVLITSAIGGEGKTTLAAQLAGRCANAGLSTLLIDADLRRPMLARLLEVPEQPGLAEVLTGEAEPEAALAVIGNAGGFHLMPAGGAGHDPGRLFNGPAFSQLIGRLRQAFDVVIVDSSPVLPVPDAIQLGRWVDGVVLATRHDTSRSKLVERASRMLAGAGIPLLGVVVNGVRGGDASYGNYSSYRYRNAARAARA